MPEQFAFRDLRDLLAKANEELATARASGAYAHEVINDNLETAVQRVAAIIQQETRKHD